MTHELLLKAGCLRSFLQCVRGVRCGSKVGKGFRLPDGEHDKGKIAFVELRCNECHRVFGVNLPRPEVASSRGDLTGQSRSIAAVAVEDEGRIPRLISLGGEVRRIPTSGELVTSIIDPLHTQRAGSAGQGDAELPPARLNDVMTVSQLIDLVPLLQARYKEKPFENPPAYYGF